MTHVRLRRTRRALELLVPARRLARRGTDRDRASATASPASASPTPTPSPASCARTRRCAISHEERPDLAFRYHPGARLVFADGTPDILAYPMNRAGWGRLCRLLTTGNLRAEKGHCHLTLADLLAHREHLSLIVVAGSLTFAFLRR